MSHKPLLPSRGLSIRRWAIIILSSELMLICVPVSSTMLSVQLIQLTINWCLFDTLLGSSRPQEHVRSGRAESGTYGVAPILRISHRSLPNYTPTNFPSRRLKRGSTRDGDELLESHDDPVCSGPSLLLHQCLARQSWLSSWGSSPCRDSKRGCGPGAWSCVRRSPAASLRGRRATIPL
jgi:hypothetical protein